MKQNYVDVDEPEKKSEVDVNGKEQKEYGLCSQRFAETDCLLEKNRKCLSNS